MPSPLGLPVQDVVVSSVPERSSSEADSRPHTDASRVTPQLSQPQSQQQLGITTHASKRQASGSDKNDISSSSSISSLQLTQSPVSSSDVLVSETSATKGRRAKEPSNPHKSVSLTSTTSLRPQSAGFNRRKIFGRSTSIRDMLGVGGCNDDEALSPANRDKIGLHYVSSSPATPSGPPPTKEQGGLGFLRHIGSKSFLNISDSKGMSASSDYLPLTSPEAQGSKRLSESLKLFGRRRGRSVSRSLDTPKAAVSEFGQGKRINGEASLTGSSRHSGDSSGSITSSERKQISSGAQIGRIGNSSTSSDSPAALPKRLSGWLHNMVGSDSTANDLDVTISPSLKETSTVSERAVDIAHEQAEDLHSQELLHESSASTTSTQSPQTNSALLTSPKSSVGSRAGALLQTLTSAPAKAVKSNIAASPHNGSVWGPSGVGIDRAFRFFLDNDTESKAEEDIWLLGVWHGPSAVEPGNLDSGAQESPVSSQPLQIHQPADDSGLARRLGHNKHASQPAKSCNTADTVSSADSIPRSSPGTSLSRANSNSTSATLNWQANFQQDFSSRIWCTYRNHFAPITRDGTISEEAASAAEMLAAPVAAAITQAELTSPNEATANRNWLGRKATDSMSAPNQLAATSAVTPLGFGAALGASYATATSSLGDKMGISNFWGRATAAAQAAGFTRGLTTDAGWGCMLRTGQSLLANALMDVHLGRSWLRESPPLQQHQFYEQLSSSQTDRTAEDELLAAWRQKRHQHATYVKVLSWFFDDASPASPFSVHRMAREGKRLGKEVGEWFGPSTAAGAIKQLVSDFSEASIGVVLDHDGVFHLNEVRASSAQQVGTGSRRKPDAVWQRPVLILIGIRLGLESVNPIYYDSVKATFSFPQSVGIAGGRPSSSYYFMGHQGNSLFYLDPHNVRPAVPLRFPPKTYPSAVPEHLDVAYRYEKDPRDDEEEWWAHAYGEAQTSTYHCEKVRRMPIKSLDPSMLLGFLVKNEASLLDLCTRIKSLPKTIFSFADSAPTWIDDDDFDPSMESFSESSAGGDFDDKHQENRSDTEFDTGVLAGPHLIGRNLAGAPSPRTPGLYSSDLDSSTLAKQRTAEWLDRGHSSSGSGIAFPSLDVQNAQPLRRPSGTDMRLVSSSSTVTTRPGVHDRPLRDPTAAMELTDATRGTSISTDGLAIGDDDSFSTMHLSGSEADSGWEEVSEVGTIAPSASAAAVAHLVLGESPSSEPADGDAGHAFVDSVLVERPSNTRTATDLSDLISDMVAVSLDTPVRDVSQTSAEPSADQARVSMELGSVGTHTPTRRKNPDLQAPKAEPAGYFELT